ncbi:YiiD C-terminal domain-containing protein [Luteimonas cucumeris]|nr:YiiD C-terminal domain-containing protein [Luteimonas cucumeris]
MNTDTALAKLDAYYQAMPPVAAMHLRIAHYDGERLRLQAPLAHHVNDKGCAFGGSMNSLMTLASWGLVSMRLEAAGLHSDVYVADNQVRYLAPLFADLEAEAELSTEASWDDFIASLRARGRARTHVEARVPLPDGGVAATFRARFVAFAKG